MDPVPVQAQSIEPTPTDNQTNVIKKGSFHPSKLLFIIPGVIVVAAILILTFFINKRAQNQTPPEEPLPALVPATPMPTPEPVIQAKTYINTARDFTFLYPETHQIIECDSTLHLFKKSTESPVVDINDFCADPTSTIQIEHSDLELSSEYAALDAYKTQTRQTEIAKSLSTLLEISKTDELAEGSNKIIQIIANTSNGNFKFTLLNPEDQDIFNQITSSFNFIVDPTENWVTFENTNSNYKLKHPPAWTIAQVSPTQITLQKNPNDTKLKSALIDVSTKQNAQLSASEIISSTRTLAGWVGSPSLSFGTIDKAPMQIIEGKFNGGYQSVVVIWRNASLIQMNWNDSADKSDTQTFHTILSTLEFIR